jgi:hypothetical protein
LFHFWGLSWNILIGTNFEIFHTSWDQQPIHNITVNLRQSDMHLGLRSWELCSLMKKSLIFTKNRTGFCTATAPCQRAIGERTCMVSVFITWYEMPTNAIPFPVESVFISTNFKILFIRNAYIKVVKEKINIKSI